MKKLVFLTLMAVMTLSTLTSCIVANLPVNTELGLEAEIQKIPDPKPDNETDRKGFEFTTENYPKMGGSLANLPLGEAVTATVLGIDRDSANAMITFEGSTTDNYEALVDGTFDIILAYEMGEDAVKYATDKGVELEMTPIGTDALVFICSLENKVESLTMSQIEQI